MPNHPIITISREYGSGGHDIGKLLAEKLNLPFYDSELIAIAAKDSGFAERSFEEAETKATSPLSYALGMVGTGGKYNMPLNNQLFMIQSSLIRTIADRESAVIVGRCADYVLRDYAPCINIFIQADLESRIQRVITRDHLLRSQAEKKIQKMDKSRATYYNFYSDQRWGDRRNYDIIINSSIGDRHTVGILTDFINHRLPELAEEAEKRSQEEKEGGSEPKE